MKRERNRFSLSVGGSENHKVKTEKAILYGSYWLPITVEEEYEIHIWGMKVKIYRSIEFDSYVVNPEEFDSSTFSNKKIVYNIDPELEKKVFIESPHPNRLTREEQEQIIKKIEDKFSSHENLRGVDYKTFTGDRMANSTLENSVNGSGFYDHGLKLGIIKALKLHFWSGIGWRSLSEKSKGFAVNVKTPTQTTDGIYHEFGIGLSDSFNIVRLDFMRNSISKNKILISLNVLG